MLSSDQTNDYHERGFLAVEGLLPRDLIEKARSVVDEFAKQSRSVTEHTSVYDLHPGSHRWPILDHHQDGVFVGAIDVEREGVDVSGAVPVTVGAGGITLHHTRMLHASAPNTSSVPRRLLLLQLAAVDAWPVMGVADLAQFDSWVLRGQPTTRYRVAEMDIRIPLPKHERQGSIYEIQTWFRPKLFAGTQSSRD